LEIQHLPSVKKHPLKNSKIQAAKVNHMAFPICAVPTAFMRAFATKKSTMSKMNASKATAAANPDTQVLQHVIDISRT
jgi:hypothetical protein